MPPIAQNLSGNKYGRLTVIERVYRDDVKTIVAYWKCKCDCGNETIVQGAALKRGTTVSCGCYGRERRHLANTTHGKTGTREYANYKRKKRRELEKYGNCLWDRFLDTELRRVLKNKCVVCGTTEE